MKLLQLMLPIALLAPSIAKAEPSCPDPLPRSARGRRQLAGQWFERGQRAAEAKRFDEAVRAYACSMRIVQHAFTAYNLGLAAEKANDPETALEGYRRYLALAPNAKDRTEVEEKIRTIETSLKPEPHPPPPIAPPPPELAPPPPPIVPPPRTTASTSPPEEESLLAAGVITLSSGAAIGIVGVVLNVVARSRADASRDAFDNEDFDRSDDLHGQARAMAYSSYAGIGVGIAAAVAGGVLLIID
jgi:tetratricopeptide (TPR) repeat protein